MWLSPHFVHWNQLSNFVTILITPYICCLHVHICMQIPLYWLLSTVGIEYIPALINYMCLVYTFLSKGQNVAFVIVSWFCIINQRPMSANYIFWPIWAICGGGIVFLHSPLDICYICYLLHQEHQHYNQNYHKTVISSSSPVLAWWPRSAIGGNWAIFHPV